MINKGLKTMKKKYEHVFLNKHVQMMMNVLLILFLAFCVTILMTLYIDKLPQNIHVGYIAAKDYKADRDYELVDEKSTAQMKKEALLGVRPVYDYDSTLENETISRIHDSFESVRLYLVNNHHSEQIKMVLSDDQEIKLRSLFMDRWGSVVDDDQYSAIRQFNFDGDIELLISQMVEKVMHQPIIHNKEDLEPLVDKGFVLRTLTSSEPFIEEDIYDLENIQSLTEARAMISKLNLSELDLNINSKYLKKDNEKVLKQLAASLIKSNVHYNGIETDARKQRAIANVKNVIIKIKRGESIIRSGDRFEARHVVIFKGIRETRLQSNKLIKFFGVFLFVNLVLLIVYYYASRYINKFSPSKKDLIFIGTTLLFFLFVLRIGVALSSIIRDALPFDVSVTTLSYAIPLAGGAMLIRFILNSEIALVFAVIVSLFSGIFLENNLELTFFYLISGVFAAHAIAHVDKRSTVLLSGALAGVVNAVTIFSLDLISQMSISGISVGNMLINCVTGFFGGLFTAMLVLILTPIAEALFNYTTDIKLLELANLSHPLLKQMIVTSPGTYHHSQLVGILSEAAAQEIHANPLFARVASYYHDIGKMKKAQYFIENQNDGNPHDKLAPSMSALIINAHVKDGLELAKAYKLPQRIADMIPQHQGTKVIGYFYNKAKEQAEGTGVIIDENDYRYPGPRPQTKEAGIIMMADAVEAAVRSLPEKSQIKIKGVVEKIVNHHFIDEQLDECELTLRDLHRIANAFIKILNGIYHQRIEYPENVTNKVTELVVSPRGNGIKNENLSEQSSPERTNISPLFKGKN